MNTYQLTTERLNLRILRSSDTKEIHTMNLLPETDEFNTSETPKHPEETRLKVETWISDNNQEITKSFTFVVEIRNTGVFTGLINIHLKKEKYRNAEVWFKFHKDYWNKGYATEALREIIRFGFDELNLHRIEAGCAIANTGSWKVMEKAGMIREAHTRQLLPLRTGWSDNYGYAILETD